VGDVVMGMSRQGYQVSLGDHGAGQWIAVFSAGHAASSRWRRGDGAGGDAVGSRAARGVGRARES